MKINFNGYNQKDSEPSILSCQVLVEGWNNLEKKFRVTSFLKLHLVLI